MAKRKLPLILFGLTLAVFATAGQGEVTARRLTNLLRERLLLSRQIAMARYNAAQRLFLAKWKREKHPKFTHVPSLATSKQRAKDLDLAIARMSGKQALGTSWQLFKSTAAKIQFPKADRDCFDQAWKTAIGPTTSP